MSVARGAGGPSATISAPPRLHLRRPLPPGRRRAPTMAPRGPARRRAAPALRSLYHAVDERRRAAGLEDDRASVSGVQRITGRTRRRPHGGRRLAERREGVAADAEPRKGRLEEALVGRVHDRRTTTASFSPSLLCCARRPGANQPVSRVHAAETRRAQLTALSRLVDGAAATSLWDNVLRSRGASPRQTLRRRASLSAF